MKLMKTTALVAAMSAVAMGAQAGQGDSPNNNAEIPNNNCFWTGPYVKENPVTNIAYPDTGAKYWATNFAMPEGSSLELHGRYMHNRYMSYNSYDIAGPDATYSPVSAIADVDIKPDHKNAKNPYGDGNKRGTPLRNYTVNVIPGAPQAVQPENSLFSNAAYGERGTIVLRSYVEDSGTGDTAGEYLPAPVLTLADGTVLTDVEEICAAADVDSSIVNIPLIPPLAWDQLNNFGNPYHLDATEENPQILKKAFLMGENLNCDFFGACPSTPNSQPGFYANLDNQYVFGTITNAQPVIYPEAALGLPEGSLPLGIATVGFAPNPDLAVSVFRGKMPTTPSTVNGDKYADESADVRYWSFCTNGWMDQKVTDCLYDEQVTVDENGYYEIVVSSEEDRPSNAKAECGSNWLPMSADGDGYEAIMQQEVAQGELDPAELTTPNQLGQPRATNPHQTLIIVRNMLPNPEFEHAIQNVPNSESVESVMGEYATKYFYESVSDYEARGCN